MTTTIRCRAVRRLLIAAAVIGAFTTPALSKEIWLDCGETKLMLDTDKETFTFETGETLIKGNAAFYSTQINFEFIGDTNYRSKVASKFKDEWSIDRKTLSFTRSLSTGHELFRGSITWSDKQESTGKCRMIAAPRNLI